MDHHSEHIFFDIIDSTPIRLGVIEVRVDQIYSVYANGVAAKAFKVPAYEKHFLNIHDQGVSAETVALWVDRLSFCLEKQRHANWETRSEADGKPRISSVTINYIGNSGAGFPQFSYVSNEITETKELKQRLLDQEAVLNMALQFGNLGFWEIDIATQKVVWSETMRNVFGLKKDFDLNKINQDFFFECVYPADRDSLKKNLADSIFSGKDHYAEFRIQTPEGKLRWILGQAKIRFSEQGQPLVAHGIARDITEKKMREEERTLEFSRVSHMAKLSALGEMASSIGHEINNPVSIIQGYADVLLKKSDRLTPEKISETAENIRSVCQRMSKIIAGLRFSTHDATQDPLLADNLGDIVLHSLDFCNGRLNRRGITIRQELDSESILIACKTVQVSQIFLNLISNAIDALANTRKAVIYIRTYREGRYGVLEVEDNGQGVSAEAMGKIFDPFFTTKSLGQGTGLGLSLCRSMLASQGGDIEWMGNFPGARFKIRVPLATDKLKHFPTTSL